MKAMPKEPMRKKPDEATLMQHLMKYTRDNVYFMDRGGRIVMISDEGSKWLGFDGPEEVLGKTDLDIFTEEHGREAYEDEQRIMQTGIPIVGKEEKETWQDNHDTWVSTTKMPLRDDDDRIVGTFGISRDITEHKNAELLAARYAEENRRLCDEMGSDLKMAAELQKTFLPNTYPAFPRGTIPDESAVRFCHHYHSSGTVGGDFCSIRRLSENQAGILLCDVMGHGVRSALIAALIRARVEEISSRIEDPGQFLNHMNKALGPIIQQGQMTLHVTACYMVLDASTGNLRHAIAGHPEPILLNAANDQAEWLTDTPEESGPALGVDDAAGYRTRERILNPSDAIILYTDGLYEVANTQGEEFGTERLLEMANRHRNQLLRYLFPELINEVRRFAQGEQFDDDVCLVGFRLARLMEPQPPAYTNR